MDQILVISLAAAGFVLGYIVHDIVHEDVYKTYEGDDQMLPPNRRPPAPPRPRDIRGRKSPKRSYD